MEKAQNNPFKQLCRENNKVHETYYGTTHRANFSINGERGDWDILHIEIPFPPQKEAELMRRFGISREELPSFYAQFEKAVVRHSTLIKNLNDLGIDAVRRSIVEYKSVRYFPKTNKEGKQTGLDFYFFSEPMEDFVGTDIIKSNGAYLLDINLLALRLLQTAKTFNDNGFTIGAVDLDSCYYADDNGKKYLKLGYSFYGTGCGIAPESYTADVKAFIADEVAKGDQAQSLDTDVKMICSFIWNLLNGGHYTDPCVNSWIAGNYYASAASIPSSLAPLYAPPALSTLLLEGMAKGASSMKILQSGIRAVNKQITAGEIENTYIIFSEPGYVRLPLPELRVDEPDEQDEKEISGRAEENPGEKEKNKRKPRKSGIVIAALAIIFLLSGAAYMLLGPGGIISQLRAPVKMSSSQGLYVSSGRVLNADATANEEYILDSEGNIVLASDPTKIVFKAEQVSKFIFVEDLEIAITDKQFTRNKNIEPDKQVLQDNVIDLRGIEDLTYDSSAGNNTIPKSLVEEYGINGESLILIRDKKYPDDNFKITMLVAPLAQEENNPESPVKIVVGSEAGQAVDHYDGTITIVDAEEKAKSLEAGDIFSLVREDGMEESFVVREITEYDNQVTIVKDAVNNSCNPEEKPVESEDDGLLIQAVTTVSEEALYKEQGEWRFTLDLTLLPADAVDRKITLTSESAEYMHFLVKNKDGEDRRTKSAKLTVRKAQEGETPTQITIVGLMEGKYIISVESEDGALHKRVSMTFMPSSEMPEITPPVASPTPTPTPTPVPTPTPSPTPEPTPAPTPTPTPEPTQWYTTPQYYPGSGGGPIVITPEPIYYTPAPTSAPTPEPTPEPYVPLSCAISHLDLNLGESYRLGDDLEGIESLNVIRYLSSPGGIVSISPTEGFLVTAESAGNCVIHISKGEESVEVSVTVTDPYADTEEQTPPDYAEPEYYGDNEQPTYE